MAVLRVAESNRSLHGGKNGHDAGFSFPRLAVSARRPAATRRTEGKCGMTDWPEVDLTRNPEDRPGGQIYGKPEPDPPGPLRPQVPTETDREWLASVAAELRARESS